MTAGIVLLAFGEPEEPTLDAIVPFLERIFSINASLEEGDEEAQRRRSRELAERRAPGLLEEYEAIGGSPLNRQARARAGALQAELSGRDLAVRTYVGMQFTDPPVSEAVNRAREEGVERLVGLPVYPLCGPSTTVAALRDLSAAVSAAGWEVERADLSGWHRHPDYLALPPPWPPCGTSRPPCPRRGGRWSAPTCPDGTGIRTTSRCARAGSPSSPRRRASTSKIRERGSSSRRTERRSSISAREAATIAT